jgi:predicted ATP-grasp superfamily ATP-dependent carboligase
LSRMGKVLLTDCWTRKTLSAVRSLGAEGLEVHAVTHKRLSPAVYSRFVRRRYIFPDPSADPNAYLDRILDLLKKEKFDCLIPFEEISMEIFLGARQEIEKYTRLPLPERDSFHLANNKWATLQLAAKAGIPVPLSFLPSNEDELAEHLKQLKFPVILKPATSSGSRGLAKAESEKEAIEIFSHAAGRYGAMLVQECIPLEGEGVGVGVLAEKGKVLVSFSYKRLREFPVKGGPSTLRESTNDPELKNYAAKLIGALNWDGVAMVEFKRDTRDGKPKLMEVNSRFWGALHLAYVSGVNFPYLLYLWAQGGEVKQPVYKTGIKCRWLLPGDVAHFISSRRRFSMKPGFFRFRGMYYDDFMRGDAKGNWASIWCNFLTIFDAETWRKGVFRK